MRGLKYEYKTIRQMAKEYMEHERKRNDFFFLHISSGKTLFAILLTFVVFIILWQRYINLQEHKNDQYLSEKTPAPINKNVTPEHIRNLMTIPTYTPVPSTHQLRNLLGTPTPSNKTPKKQISPEAVRNLIYYP